MSTRYFLSVRPVKRHSSVHCNENPINVFLFWELRDLSPNFHIHVSASDLYFLRIGPHISCSIIGRSMVGIYTVNRSQTHECGNWDCGGAIPFLGIFVLIFGYWFYAVYNWISPFSEHFLEYLDLANSNFQVFIVLLNRIFTIILR
jgi:hypothetical protein